ncbi:unnamed protein product, partial [Callosobruchus maculatus]
MVTEADLRVVTKRQPTEQELRDALFCWKVAKEHDHRDRCRPDEPRLFCEIAGIKAGDEGLEVKGSAMASDAFFPVPRRHRCGAAVGIT